MPNSSVSVALEKIDSMDSNIILRGDLKGLMSENSISSALKVLCENERIVKISLGIYAKLSYSKLLNKKVLVGGIVCLARESLTRLNISWKPSQEEIDYNSGKTQQIPVNPTTLVPKGFSRKFKYMDMEPDFECVLI